MLTWILAIKAVVEVAALAVLGRSLLGLLVGARRDNNLAYQVLSVVARPALRLARLLSPRIVIDRHLPLVALLLKNSNSLGEGFTLSLEVAATTLVVGAIMYVWMVRAYPMSR